MSSTPARALKKGQRVRIEGAGVITRAAKVSADEKTATFRWRPDASTGLRDATRSYTVHLPADHPVKHPD